MRFNIDNIKEVLETYDLCLFFDSKEEKKINEPPKEDIEELNIEDSEFSIVETTISTKVVKVPFYVDTDDKCEDLFICVKPVDLPKIIVENIKLCKDNKEYLTFDKSLVNNINDIIRNNKNAKIIRISILIASSGTAYGR